MWRSGSSPKVKLRKLCGKLTNSRPRSNKNRDTTWCNVSIISLFLLRRFCRVNLFNITGAIYSHKNYVQSWISMSKSKLLWLNISPSVKERRVLGKRTPTRLRSNFPSKVMDSKWSGLGPKASALQPERFNFEVHTFSVFRHFFYKMFSEWSEAEVRSFETSVTAWFWSERGWVYSIFCSWSWHRQGAIELAAGSDWNASQRLKSEGCLATLLVPNLERASLKVTKTSNGWRNSINSAIHDGFALKHGDYRNITYPKWIKIEGFGSFQSCFEANYRNSTLVDNEGQNVQKPLEGDVNPNPKSPTAEVICFLLLHFLIIFAGGSPRLL